MVLELQNKSKACQEIKYTRINASHFLEQNLSESALLPTEIKNCHTIVSIRILP